ncbi:unnamed protein product [Urochloa humidicola]
MAGDLMIKRTFEVPACPTSDGTLLLCPYFHRSPFFAAAGYEWFICYYPDSLYHHDGIDLCLHLNSPGARVKISSGVSLLDPTGSLPPLNLMKSPPLGFDSDDDDRRSVTHWVPKCLLNDAQAAQRWYLRARGTLMFEWTITVLPEMPMPVPMPMAMEMPKIPATEVTPMPMPESEPELEPEPKVPAAPDVTFSVGEELFQAHKAILALRSPIFKLQLSGSMTTQAAIDVIDMRPDAFQALLRYIYTDTLPADTEEGQAGDDVSELTRHLLVAAARYDMMDLKLLCEQKLSKMVGVDNFADMLAFAGEQRSYVLESACIEFIQSSGRRMLDVVASKGYQLLRKKHPLILVRLLEKSFIFRNVFPAKETLDDVSDY